MHTCAMQNAAKKKSSATIQDDDNYLTIFQTDMNWVVCLLQHKIGRLANLFS